MGKFKDLTGQQFGRWTVLYYDEEKSRKTKRTYWVCQCSCEDKTIKSVRADELGKSSCSCGCLHKEMVSSISTGNKYSKKYNTYDLSGEYGIGYTSKGEEFWFDLEDYDKIKDYCWNISPKGYVVCANNINGVKTTSYFQRMLFKELPSSTEMQIDHINHNRFDNRKNNLRICTPSQNCMNKSLRPDNTTGVPGVYWYKPSNQWVAKICANKNEIHLGYFDIFEDAVLARKQAEEKYFGEYSYDNSMKTDGVICEDMVCNE